MKPKPPVEAFTGEPRWVGIVVDLVLAAAAGGAIFAVATFVQWIVRG